MKLNAASIALSVLALSGIAGATCSDAVATTASNVKVATVYTNVNGNTYYTLSNGAAYWVDGTWPGQKAMNQYMLVAWQMGITMDVSTCAWKEVPGYRQIISTTSK